MATQDTASRLDVLFQNVKSFRSTVYFKDLLKVCKQFKHLAPYNAMLVYMQRPGAQYVLNENDWKYKFDRGIKNNARPIIILIPFGPVDYMFEISDTYPLTDNAPDTEKILKELSEPFRTSDNVNNNIIAQMTRCCAFNGIFVKPFEAGDSFAGQIQHSGSDKEDITIHFGIKDKDKLLWKSSFLLNYNSKSKSGEQLATIAHELGHLFCYHLSAPQGWKQWKVRNLSHEAEEFEAESVSWLVCDRLEIETPSDSYLHDYLDNNGEIPFEVSIERIFSAFNEVWKMTGVDRKMFYREGLLYKHDKKFADLMKEIMRKKFQKPPVQLNLFS